MNPTQIEELKERLRLLRAERDNCTERIAQITEEKIQCQARKEAINALIDSIKQGIE